VGRTRKVLRGAEKCRKEGVPSRSGRSGGKSTTANRCEKTMVVGCVKKEWHSRGKERRERPVPSVWGGERGGEKACLSERGKRGGRGVNMDFNAGNKDQKNQGTATLVSS